MPLLVDELIEKIEHLTCHCLLLVFQFKNVCVSLGDEVNNPTIPIKIALLSRCVTS